MTGIITNISYKSEVSCQLNFDLLQNGELINITLEEEQAVELNKFLDLTLIQLEDYKTQIRSKLIGL